jgi:AraC-like DNA-binding protein
VLARSGDVFGIKFRPGGFYPLWRAPIAELLDRRVRVADAFGRHGALLAQALEHDNDSERRMQLAERFLRTRLSNAEGTLEDRRAIALIDRIVTRVIADRTITKAQQLADSFDLNVRALQRLFQRYDGISPKWLLQRYRLHEALEHMKQSEMPNWPQLALHLGYSDQAHFVRNFRTLVGKTPFEYMQLARAKTSMTSSPGERLSCPWSGARRSWRIFAKGCRISQ